MRFSHGLTPLTSAAILPLLLLGGCVVGPNYGGPPPVAPEAVRAGAFHNADGAGGAPVASHWWKDLGDAELDRLEDAAFAGDPDLDAALARVRQARAATRQAVGGLLPSTEATGLYLATKGLTSAFGGAQAAAGGGTLSFYDVGFDATWEIDLFGGQRRAIEGARAQAQAAQARVEDAQVSLAAEVAQAYVDLRDAQAHLAQAQRAADLAGQVRTLTAERRQGGTASDLDLERATGQFQSSEASTQSWRSQIVEQMNRLAVLTGRAPGELDAELASASPPPSPPAVVAVGDPAGLLRRRPDIRAAEQALIQKNALIGQRTADLFPKIELLGSIGSGSTNLTGLFAPASLSYTGAPILQWRPFDFGRTQAGIEEARGERAEALAQYRKAVLGALEDAETALARYGRQRDDVVNLTEALAAADRTAGLTAKRVAGGTASQLDVLAAEQHRLSAQADLTTASDQLTLDYVALQKSLGLGWEAPGARTQPPGA